MSETGVKALTLRLDPRTRALRDLEERLWPDVEVDFVFLFLALNLELEGVSVGVEGLSVEAIVLDLEDTAFSGTGDDTVLGARGGDNDSTGTED
jgi:hypothetical protein